VLRGATFGVLSLSEGSSKLIPKIMASVGLSPSDYTIVAAGGAPARATLLREGKIDAALQPMPLHYEAEAAGLNCLAWAGTYEPEWQFNTINANIEWARREPQTIVGLLRALLRAEAFMLANPDEAARIAATELHTEPGFATRAVTDAIELGIFNPGFECSNSALARIFQNMQDDGAIPLGEKFQMERFVEHEFLHKARQS
jgi:NitT/TauT family transport system substrate-binding protein